METLFLLIASHYLADFALQNDFMAANKSPRSGASFWWQILTGHCVIQALGIYLVTHSLALALSEFTAHWAIDYMKCQGRLSFNQDQALHIVCKLTWWAIISLV